LIVGGRSDKILGATIVAAHAGEMISELTLAMVGSAAVSVPRGQFRLRTDRHSPAGLRQDGCRYHDHDQQDSDAPLEYQRPDKIVGAASKAPSISDTQTG
jgi:hypothetical protein